MIPEHRVTVQDVRHKAEEVRDLAVSEARELARQQGTKVVIAGAIVLVVALSAAYYLGTRAACRGYAE